MQVLTSNITLEKWSLLASISLKGSGSLVQRRTTETLLPRDTPMIPNLPDASRKDRLAEREGMLPKCSRRAALVLLAMVLLVTLTGITLFLTLGHESLSCLSKQPYPACCLNFQTRPLCSIWCSWSLYEKTCTSGEFYAGALQMISSRLPRPGGRSGFRVGSRGDSG